MLVKSEADECLLSAEVEACVSDRPGPRESK